MSNLPAPYAWLANEKAPRILVEALKLYGVKEIPGPQSNSLILGWAQKLGGWVAGWYKNDDIPWCGLFMAEVCRRADLPVVREPLKAASWAGWGEGVRRPMLGDVLVFVRDGGGHVGIYVGEDDAAYHVLGGNQGNAVSITRIMKNRLQAARRTDWRIAQPAGVRIVKLSPLGAVSANEA